MKSVIYETKGRAREFSELAINLFGTCDHMCTYCYGANVLHIDRKEFEVMGNPRVTVKELYDSASEWAKKGETRRVLLCFITDPYQKSEAESQITRKAITALHAFGLNVVILTKGGYRSMRDFDLLGPKDAYATTLTLVGSTDSLKWEPGAAVPRERIDALQEAHHRGIETWVSFEPVIFPEDTFRLLGITSKFVNHFKIGIMNYNPHGKTINWYNFGWEMKRHMDIIGAKYYFKRDLLIKMGVKPDDFKQTWVCQ
jgi:DNA repair photolyase